MCTTNCPSYFIESFGSVSFFSSSLGKENWPILPYKNFPNPPSSVCFSLFHTMFTLWSLPINSDTSCKSLYWNTEAFLSGINMWYQFIIPNNVVRNPLTWCTLTLKGPFYLFHVF
ncbi:UNVERIFIED_CONTAM: hypothetical protein K2H54_069124 [Gekko kuhli]